jgi:4-amino-4-deoxy-L-arabinose transferase-like glycosyltransferase
MESGKMRRVVKPICDVLNKGIAHQLFVPCCFVGGTFVRLVWIWLVNVEQVSDFSWYYIFGSNIAAGRGYSLEGLATGYWPIGYPGLLGFLFFMFGPSVFLAKVVNVILYMMVIFLTYNLSRRIFQNEQAARITLCLLCFYPNHIAYTALLSAEIVFVFLVACGAFLFVHARDRAWVFLLSGFLCGLATLTKPHAIILPFVFAGFFSRNVRVFIRSNTLVYGMVFLTISPWLVRNYNTFGVFTLAHTGGINLLDGNNPYATGRHNFDEKVNALLGDLRTEPLEYMWDGKEVERDAKATSLAVDFIIHNPDRVLMLWPRKLVALFLSDVDGFHYSMGMQNAMQGSSRTLYMACRVIGELYYIIVILLFIVSLIALQKGEKVQLVGLAIVVSFTLIHLILFGNARYHFPMMPWIAIYSGAGGHILLSFFVDKKTSRQYEPSMESAAPSLIDSVQQG